jgi:hypothetical protein
VDPVAPVDQRVVGHVTRLRQVALVVLAAAGAVVGFWAQLLPRSFYDDFPGAGRVWVAVDGPYNEHLVRDIGGLNLGLAFVAVLALVSGSVLVARAAGGAALIYGVPHLAYHATHLDDLDTDDQVALLVSLALAVVAGIAAVAAPARTSDDRGAPVPS